MAILSVHQTIKKEVFNSRFHFSIDLILFTIKCNDFFVLLFIFHVDNKMN